MRLDRRRQPMFWNMIERTTNLVFLLLAVVILSSQWKNDNTSSQVDALRKEIMNVNSNNIHYLENKANRIAESSDDYQTSTSRRLYILEGRLDILEKENRALKLQAKQIITNTNTANAIVNGKKEQ